MERYLHLMIACLAFGGILGFPYNDGRQRRNIRDVLQKTAKSAEIIGKEALKYFVPSSMKSGMAVVKPFLKRSVKRSVMPEAIPAFGQLPYNYGQYAVPSYYNNWQYAYWQNPAFNFWRPVPRSVIPTPYYPQYYPQYFPQQQYYQNDIYTRTLQNYPAYPNNAAGNDNQDTKASLKEFQNLVSKVDSALVSYTDKTGVTLNENLKGVAKSSVEEGSDKRSKTPKEMQKEGVDVITKTFTDFVCGDNC